MPARAFVDSDTDLPIPKPGHKGAVLAGIGFRLRLLYVILAGKGPILTPGWPLAAIWTAWPGAAPKAAHPPSIGLPLACLGNGGCAKALSGV